MPKRLSDDELADLRQWLTKQQINPNRLSRDFSDAVPVAQLLKKLQPKLVDLHNYPPRSSIQLKLDNWETLNFKVLSKMGINQSKPMLEKYAKAMPGAIETLLYEIMVHNRESKQEQKADEQEQIWSENDDVIMVNVNKRLGDAIVQVPQKMILFSIYEQTLRDSQAKDSCLNAAHQRIAHLENILKLKAERIDELCAQLAKLSNADVSHIDVSIAPPPSWPSPTP